MASKEEEAERLLTPSLSDVRTHQIGKFLDYSLSISGSKKHKTIFHLKSVVHPKWFEHHHTTQQMDLYLSEKALDFLLSESKVSGRWPRKRKWRKKKDNDSVKGEWYYKSRTPKGSSWIAASNRSPGQKGKSGRKPGGDAYRVRRETWRTFGHGKGHIAGLLGEALHESKEKTIKKKFPIRLPNLSLAVEEIIITEIWPELVYNREHLVNDWLNLRGVRKYLQKHGVDSELCEQFTKGTLLVDERNRLIHLICQKHWRKILAQWIELEIFSRHMPPEGRFLKAISKAHAYEIKKHVHKVNKPKRLRFFDCDCPPNETNIQYDFARGEILCNNCWVVAGKILSSINPVTKEEQFIFSC